MDPLAQQQFLFSTTIISHFSLLERRADVFFYWILFADRVRNGNYKFFHQHSIGVFTGFTRTRAIINHFSLLESRCLLHWILLDNVQYGDYNQYSITVFTGIHLFYFALFPECPKYEILRFLLAVYNYPTSSSFP